jgi:hypothetical protein
MSPKRQLCLLFACAVLFGASDPPWKVKQIPDWDGDDAKLVLTDSPWAGSVTPSIAAPTRQRAGGSGRGGIGIGLPGIGMGRPRSGGYPASPPPDSGPAADPPVLQVRWESALPIREAELKAREVNAPDIDPSCYAIAVYGVPARMASGSEKTLAAQFKRQAAIKREGQKDLKPSSVQVLQRDDGPVIVYLFPRKVEITRKDRRVEFDAQIATLQLMKAFYTGDMTWQSKLEL